MTDTETGGKHAYDDHWLAPMVGRLVERSKRADHAAQRVDREYYAHYRLEAFEFRKMAREGLEVDEDAEAPETDWPTYGEVTHRV